MNESCPYRPSSSCWSFLSYISLTLSSSPFLVFREHLCP